MAMTVRFTPEMDAALQRVADATHTSKHSVVLRAVEEMVVAESKREQVMASVERTIVRDAELLARLEDA
jgi:predicted transcriptional regulator